MSSLTGIIVRMGFNSLGIWGKRGDHSVGDQIKLQSAIDTARDNAEKDPKRRLMWLTCAAILVGVLGYPY